MTQIDFDPFVAKKKFPTRIIKKNTLLAMFYNNKGAEALVYNNYTLAYQYLKAASEHDAKFYSTWGNLGILYKLTGHHKMAEKAYRHAISLNHKNLTSLTNLALLLKKQDRVAEAKPIKDYLTNIRMKNPYYHALLGNQYSHNQQYQQAIEHYQKAIKLDDSQHEFYFALAKNYYQQNKLNLAKKTMKHAIKLSGKQKVQSKYIAKLNFLKRPH